MNLNSGFMGIKCFFGSYLVNVLENSSLPEIFFVKMAVQNGSTSVVGIPQVKFSHCNDLKWLPNLF